PRPGRDHDGRGVDSAAGGFDATHAVAGTVDGDDLLAGPDLHAQVAGAGGDRSGAELGVRVAVAGRVAAAEQVVGVDVGEAGGSLLAAQERDVDPVLALHPHVVPEGCKLLFGLDDIEVA